MSEPKPSKPASPRQKPQQKARRKKPAAGKQRRALIKPHPEDLKREEKSIKEKLQAEATTGLPGVGASLILHLLLLGFLWLIVFTTPSGDGEPGLDMGWLPFRSAAVQQAANNPLNIGPLPIQKVEEKPKEDPKEALTKTGQSREPVKPPPVKRTLTARNPRLRSGVLSKNGGSNRTEDTIKFALDWMVRQQGNAGNWQLHAGYPDAGSTTLKTDAGATSLALLAFLGMGNTHTQGDYQTVVGKGVRWLVGNQAPSGDLHNVAEMGRRTTYYVHSMATIVLCESYALTQDESLREPAERAIAFLLDSQNPVKGGWKYRKQTELTNGDLSVTGWALMALNTARMANIEVPDDAFNRTSFFLDSVQEKDGARYKYEPLDPPSKVTPAMTAEGLLCRQWLGWSREFPMMQEGVQYVIAEENLPEWVAGKRNVYAWYYTAQMLHNIGGDPWKAWYAAAQKAIIDGQNRRGSKEPGEDVRGSWDPMDPPGSPHEYAEQAGRLYLTAMSLLILETPIRHLPLYEEPDSKTTETAEATGEGGD